MDSHELERRCAEMRKRSQPSLNREEGGKSARQIASGQVRGLSVKDVAHRLSLSASWVRRHFSELDGVLKIPGSNKPGSRVRLRIPQDILEREILKFTAKKTRKIILRKTVAKPPRSSGGEGSLSTPGSKKSRFSFKHF
jgi:hypothetical protein